MVGTNSTPKTAMTLGNTAPVPALPSPLLVAVATRLLLSRGKLDFYHPDIYTALGTNCYEYGYLLDGAEAGNVLISGLPSELFKFSSTIQMFKLYSGIKLLQNTTTAQTQHAILLCLRQQLQLQHSRI